MARRLVLALAALALVVVLLAAPSPRGAAQTAVAGVISGPTALGPGATAALYLNATGGPGATTGGNFSIRYYLAGPDLTDGLPLKSAPRTATNATGTFTLNVTAPQKEQVVNLVVEVNSSFGASSEKATLSHSITVITPILLTATFANAGEAAAVNVPVRFFVDGTLVGHTNISRVEPGGTGTATLSYLPVGLQVGSHTVRVEADLNGNGVIEPDKGEVVVVDVFYKEGWQLSWSWAIVIVLLTISITVLAVRRIRARPRR
jgi:hypothetical protein